MKITLEQLVDKFKSTFSTSVEVTEDICKKYCNDFNYRWVVYSMFPEELKKKYYQDCKPIDVKYNQDRVMIFYKYSKEIK